ncbi:MAG: STAS domain-containing protein [Cytophagaceae bacterium]|jgi:anti-sigma B factor antagonist|nr:STAS domain-containing protein [Cytophagaceae bacterium]
MQYITSVKNNVLILELQGDLIGESNGLELMDLVNDKLNDDVKKCAIDLSQVRYMNSSGIGVLITLLTKFRNKGGELVLINPSEQIKKLLLITKLNSIFHIVDSEADALTRLQA